MKKITKITDKIRCKILYHMILNFYNRIQFIENNQDISYKVLLNDLESLTYSGFCNSLNNVITFKIKLDKSIILPYKLDNLFNIFPEFNEYYNNKNKTYPIVDKNKSYWYTRDLDGTIIRFNILYDIFMKIYSKLYWTQKIMLSNIYESIHIMKNDLKKFNT